ncbi:membrane protein [Agromyces mangrovi Wang et al. 2018]|nr:membrane protein [Agromyces mangrovi]
MPVYRERLLPTPWMVLVSLLLIPASILILAPVSLPAGIATGIVLYLGVQAAFLVASPLIEVTETELHAGKASIPLALTGEATAHEGADATAERGVRLDARAWLLIRGWVPHVVKVPIVDDADPTPYWIVSTRRPTEMAAAINGSRRPSETA